MAEAETTTTAVHRPASAETVWLPLLVITGASVSLTVMVWRTGAAALPLASLTVQVMVVTPTGKGSVRTKPSLLIPVGSPTAQLSVAEADTTTTALHSAASAETVWLPLVVITGASVSLTVMVWRTGAAALPLASLTVQVMVVTPTGKGSVRAKPSLLIPVGSPTAQLSVAEADTTTTALHSAASAETVWLPSVVITGASVSLTVMVWMTGAAALPLASLTFQVMVVTPTG